MFKLKNYSFVIGLILLIIILLKSDLTHLTNAISKINWWWVLAAYLLDFPEVLAKSWRWQLIMKKQNIIYCLKECFFMYMSGMAAGFFTPGKLGDFSRALYLKKDGYSSGISLVSVILDRLVAMSYLLIAGYIGVLILIPLNRVLKPSLIILTILLITALTSYVILKKGWHKIIFRKIFNFIANQKIQDRFKIHYRDFNNDIKKYSIFDLIRYFLITIIPWFIYYLEFYFLAKSVAINNVPFVYLSLAITVSFFITFLPISYLGIGTREAALLFFLLPFGINRETIIVLAELALLDSFWTAGTGLFFWLIRPIPVINTSKQ